MKGLLRNTLYSMGNNLQLSFFVASIFSLFPLMSSEAMLVPALSIQMFIFVINVGSALTIDNHSRWDKFEVTLPIKREDVIKSRYLFFITLIAVGAIFALLTLVIYTLVMGEIHWSIPMVGFTFGGSISLITSAFMYPMMLKFGTEKNELIIIICVFISIGIYYGIGMLTSPLTDENMRLFEKALPNILSLSIGCIMFIGSYFVSLSIYKTKEL